MYNLQLPLLFLQISLSSIIRASSPSSPSQRVPITLTESTNLASAGDSLAENKNGVRLHFPGHGNPIPPAELTNILTEASADVEAYIPHSAHQPIDKALFEKNMTFPDTGDNIYLYVYAYGWGLNYQELYQAMIMLQRYVLGSEPGQPGTHFEELDFYIQLAHGMVVAHGAIEFTLGARATAKRNPITTTLQLPQEANMSSNNNNNNMDVPFSYHVAPNLDLNIGELGPRIPEATILYTLEGAFTDVVINHEDIEASIPINQPYSFNTTFKTSSQHAYITGIKVAPQERRSMSWSVLCLSLYGVRDFMLESGHLNMMKFEITARKGVLGKGEVFSQPVNAATA